jgi:hypothetical protein
VLADRATWAAWAAEARRRIVALDRFGDGSVRVSTVFTGEDESGRDPAPLLFESTIFWTGHDLDERIERYPTWGEALAGHRRLVERVRAELIRRWPLAKRASRAGN